MAGRLVLCFVLWSCTFSTIAGTQSLTDFPFKLRLLEVQRQSTGALVLNAHIQCTEPHGDQSPWKIYQHYAVLGSAEALFSGASWTRCFEGVTYYTCISTLLINNFSTSYYDDISLHLEARRPDGHFIISPLLFLDQIPESTYLTRPLSFVSHPPSEIHLISHEDIHLTWDFITDAHVEVEVNRYTYMNGEIKFQEIGLFSGYHQQDLTGISYQKGNIKLTIETMPSDNQSIHYSIQLSITAPTANDFGIYSLDISPIGMILRTDVIAPGQQSVYPEDEPAVYFDSCTIKHRLIHSRFPLCLLCMAAVENIQGMRMYHNGTLLSSTPSEGRVLREAQFSGEEKGLQFISQTPSLSDAGDYRCDVTLGDGTIRSYTTDVIYTTERPTITKFEITHQDDEKLILACEGTGLEEFEYTMTFRAYRRSPPDGQWNFDLENGAGQYAWQVHHRPGTNVWKADLAVDLTAGPIENLPDVFRCCLEDEYTSVFNRVGNPLKA